MMSQVISKTTLMYLFSCMMCVVAGFVLRICLEYKTDTFTLKALRLRTIITACAGYIAFIVYRDYQIRIGISIELYLSLVGFFAVFITSVFDRIAKIGIRSYLKIILKRLLAYAETEEENNGI